VIVRRLRIGIDWGMDGYSIANGQYRYAVDLINALARLGVDADFVVFGTRPQPPQEIASLFVETKGAWQWSHKPVWSGKGSHWINQGLSAWHLRRQHFDLVHCIDSTIPCWSACPVVWTLYDLMTEVFADDYQEWRNNRGYRRYRQAVREWVSHHLAISHTTSQDATRFWNVDPRTVTVVYLGVSGFPPPTLVEMACGEGLTRFTQLANHPLILAPYNLEPRKNLAAVLAAMAAVRERFPHYRLALFGRGACTPQREAEFESALVRHGLQDTVVRLGFVSDLELADLYRTAEVFVFPALYEGFGLPLLEAMSVGGCVIARDASAMAEVVGDAGLLVETKDPQILAGAILQLLDNPAERERLRAAGRVRAATFSVERMARETFDTYLRVIEQTRAPG
jgi:glycosyltransferase involved in cell wall biosynthesis